MAADSNGICDWFGRCVLDDRAGCKLLELTDILRRHRKKLGVAGAAVLLYTLLGFFLAPWLVEKLAVDTVRDRYSATLTIEKVAFNPYVLGLRIDGLAMRDPDGAPFVAVRQIYVNLQLSSLFRFAPTFREIRFDAPEVHLGRRKAGSLTADFLAQPAGPESAPEPEAESSGIPRLIIQQFVVNEAAFHWRDEVPPEPIATTFGPVNVAVANLNTLPEREGQQEVVITTETAGTLSWSGSLQLNPLRSAGRAEINGSHAPLISAYIRHQVGFDIARGLADVGFDYVVEALDDGSVRAQVDNFALRLDDVLVRTFGATGPAGGATDRDVLAVPTLAVRGGALRWPDQSVTVDEVIIESAELSLYRDADGALNIIPARDDSPGAAALEEEPGPAPSGLAGDWSVRLGRFAIDGMSIGLIDDSVQPAADLGIEGFSLSIASIDTAPGSLFPTDVSIVTRSGGTATVSGTIGVYPDAVADLELEAEGLALSETHPYLKPLADVNFDSGALGIDARLVSGPDEPMKFTGDVHVTDFLITETDEGSRLGSWDRLDVRQIDMSVADGELRVSEVHFEKPYADVFIAEDRTINLGRVEPGEQVAAPDEADDSDQPDETVAADIPDDAELPLKITIGRVVVADAAADFADFSLPLPFEAGITELNGNLTTIATASTEPSEVTMEGKVDEFGLLRVSGTLTPLEIARNTDIQLRFQNVEIPKFSAYTVAFAGREIASGKLDLDLGYEVSDSNLVGENRIVLRDFELGDKVEHPGAMSLPLGLAVALLKGADGTIDIDLPVRGKVDDPEFSYGRVIGKALVNLVVKIVASPFALLGKLVGAEAGELDHVAFIAGRSDLTPPEQERIAKLTEALAQRPELVIEASGVVDREADGLALRTARLDALIESRIEASGTSAESDAMYADLRAETIEALYSEAAAGEGATIEDLRARHTSEDTDPESGRVSENFDSVAYIAELRRLLIEQQAVTEDELVALAQARADTFRSALLAADASMDSRIRIGEPQAAEADENGGVRMDVKLAAGGD